MLVDDLKYKEKVSDDQGFSEVTELVEIDWINQKSCGTRKSFGFRILGKKDEETYISNLRHNPQTILCPRLYVFFWSMNSNFR